MPAAFETLLTELTHALRPLVYAVDEDPVGSGLVRLALETGYDIDGLLTEDQATQFASAASTTYEALLTLVTDPGGFVDQIPRVLEQVANLRDLMATLDALLPAGSDLAVRLFDYLVATYVRVNYPTLYAALGLAGIVRDTPMPANGNVPEYVAREIRWDYVAKLIDPAGLFADRYGWGTADLDSNTLLARVADLLWAIGLPARYEGPPAEGTDGTMTLTWYVSDGDLNGALGVRAEHLAAGTGELPGVALVPHAAAALAHQTDLGGGWQLGLRLQAGADSGYEVTIQPHAGARLASVPAQPPVAWTLAGELTVTKASATGAHTLLFGSPGTTRFEAVTAGLRGYTEAGSGSTVAPGDADIGVEFAVRGGRLAVQPSQGDGFLQKVLPSGGLVIDVDFLIGWSSKGGLHFDGGAGLEVTTPVQRAFGPIRLESVYLTVRASSDGKLVITGAATANVAIGPVNAAIDRVGLDATIDPRPPYAISAAFRPPSGAALSLDSGVVTGGGFLFFDPVKEQYAGALHLEFEKLTLNAIGLLTTHLPDGSRGFSLLVIVQASGFTPIQLGFGFTLNGVGGLLGINRTVAVDVLRAGVRNRTLDAILFSPDDPIPRAPQIISTLQSVFPPAVDQYVFGPMAKIGWGAPVTLVTVEIALILELPAPLRLIVLGRIRAALPDPDHTIVSINLDVVGVVDFDRSELSVDASLYDSMVGPFALTGDMAARANWGTNPDFAMALGGFHPAYAPPPGFPALRRLTLALSTSDNPRLRMEAYLALTSNTVQVGARLELYLGLGEFALEGGLGFDTLIQFSPFRLLAEIYAHLALKAGGSTLMGLDIHVHLTGPAPWVLWGEASFSIFFISITLPFRAQFGRAEDVPAIERTEVWPVLRDSLAADTNWSAHLPPQGGRLVVLRDGAGDGELSAHPLGTLTVSQSLVPLERTLGLFGSVPPKDYDRFAIVSAAGLSVTAAATQYFAPSQFRQMSDAEKLASPAYERMVSGVHLVPGIGIHVGYVQETPLDYEQSVIVDVERPAAQRLDGPYTPSGDVVAALAQHGPAATAPSRGQGAAKFAPPTPGPTVGDPTYVVVDRDTLTPVPQDGLDGSYTAAAELLRGHPDRGELQIVRSEELELV
jgi:hypothetical protein